MFKNFRLDVTGKDRGFVITSFIYILYVVFPLFEDLTHIPVFVPSSLVVIYIAICYNEVFSYAPIKWMMIYVILLFIYSLLGRRICINGVSDILPSWWRITIETAWILPSILISAVLYIRNDTKLYKLFGMGPLLLVTCSFVFILPLIMSSKNILREDMGELFIQRPIGLPDYTLMHSYTLMLLPLCYNIKCTISKGEKIFALALVAIFYYVVTQTSVTTSLFVALIIFIFSLIYSSDNPQKTIVITAILLIICYCLYKAGFFIFLIDLIMPFFDGTVVINKLQDFKDSMIYGNIQGDSLTGRIDHHQMSKDGFWLNPFFGGEIAGGHSKILDILGCSGILVFFPFAMLIITNLRMQLSIINSTTVRGFVKFSYVAALVYLYQKGIFGAAGFLTLFVIVPYALIARNMADDQEGSEHV